MVRGTLRIYLGAAPGVGKTFAMLNEGWRRQQRGTDVVVGYVETHARENTAAQLRDLEVVPRHRLEYRGAVLEEMDVDAVVTRRPQVALVDELAHTNVPGSRNEKRWQDVEELLDAGIDVITTVNVQHLESLNDVIGRITGVIQRETVPDEVVRRADQIELVDMTPEALRRRMAHGNVYPSDRIDAALANYFRPGNLGALRELALLWVADRVEESLQDYMAAHGIAGTWETRERVVVAITGAPGGDTVVRRAARMAARTRAELVGVHVTPADGLTRRAGAGLDAQRALLGELGGAYREIVGDDVPATLADFAAAEKATQLVIGASQRSRWQELARGSVVAALLRHVEQVDVHVIATEPAPGETERLPRIRRTTSISPRRQGVAWGLVLAGLPLLAFGLSRLRDDLALSTVLLLFLAAVVAISTVGGLTVGVVSAVGAFLLVNWYFTPPLHTFTIARAENLAGLVVFVLVAIVVSVLVDRAGRRAREALRARAEAEALARTTAALVADPDPLPALVDQLRSVFGLESCAVLERDGEVWIPRSVAGEHPPLEPGPGSVALDPSGDLVLTMRGPVLGPNDRRVLQAFADQLAVALQHRALMSEAEQAERLARGNELRTALLQAVSHDLRTPLASIKASVTSLQQRDVAWTDDDESAFLTTIDESTDRLDRVIGNLLDMSRLQAGALERTLRPSALEDVVAAALANVPHDPGRIVVDVPETLPLVVADPALLERAVANIVSNALAWSPPDEPVRIEAGQVGERVHLRVVDHGPGVPATVREQLFQPFQRLGDRSSDAGVGLGLAVAHGFVEAMEGSIEVDDTPGRGLTMTISLRAVTS